MSTTPPPLAESSEQLIADFVLEAVDSLHALPAQLDAFRRDPGDDAGINAVFRAVHSIKGCAGFLGLMAIKQFSHALENTLDEVRKKKLALSEELYRATVEGIDLLEEMLQRALDGQLDQELSADEAALLERVTTIADESRERLNPEEQLLADMHELIGEIAQAGVSQAEAWTGRLRKALAGLSGEPLETPSSARKVAPPETFAEGTWLCGGHDVTAPIHAVAGFFLALASRAFDDELAGQLAAGLRDLAAAGEAAGIAELAAAARSAQADFELIHSSPLDKDALTLSIVWERLAPALGTHLARPAAAASGPAASEGASEASAEKGAAAAKQRFLRVREDSVDEFLTQVSRLFISYELLKDLHARMSSTGQLLPLVEELRQVSREFGAQSAALQQSVVALRQVPIAGLFAKFPRMARTLASQIGKQIDVHLSGEEVEVDKSIVEDLDAPLTHMLRNVVDHAIEAPAERRARGVSETGNLWLSAERTRSHLVITLRDDGRGIDPVRVRNKAVEKGLITADQAAALSDQESVELIYAPGFSTAEKVSEISGRGVGMDVVCTNLREHNGEIAVQSQLNVGTTFRLVIPNREAVVVVNGLIVRHEKADFVVPFEHVGEIAELTAAEIKPVLGSQVAVVRGETYDAVHLADALGLPRSAERCGGRRPAILLHGKTGSLCLLVDEVVGHRQVVINSVQQILPGLDKVAGVSPLGGGRMALVLSVPELIAGRHHRA